MHDLIQVDKGHIYVAYKVALSVCLFSIVCLQMSPQIASLRLCKVTSLAFVWLFSTVRLKCLLNELWSAQAKSHGLHSFYFSPVWVFKCIFKWPACSLRGYKVTLVAFVWFFSTVRFQMFTQRAWVSAGKVTQAAFFLCALSDGPQNACMWGCKITQGCSTASASPTR